MSTLVAGLVVASAGLTTTGMPATASTSPPKVDAFTEARTVAPGIELDHVERIDEREWQVAHTLTVDLSKHRIGYLDPGAIAATAPLTEAADRAGAVAAINGDFYDINNSGAPVGAAFADGELLKSPSGDRTRSVAFGSDGTGRIVDVSFEGTVTLPSGEQPLSRLNSHDLPTDGIGAYTASWGTYTRGRAVLGATRVTEVLVKDGVVEKVAPTAGEGAIPSDVVVLLGREAGADTLAALRPGDRVAVDYSAGVSDGKDVRTLVGGGALLVRDGEVQDVDDSGPPFPARTGIGFSEDGRTMILVSVDGPNASHSRGGTLKELARLLVERGAHTGMELDGGGSSTLLARTPGSDHVEVENVPNDGHVRAVSNGLGIVPRTAGSGQVRGLHVAPAIDAERAATAAIVPRGRPDRVFTGLTRSMRATAHDELLGPVEQQPSVRWTATGGRMDGATFRATRPGTATVRARAGAASGQTSLEVLQPPVRIDTTAASVNLAGPDETGTIAVLGFDAHGNSAPIESRDIVLEYDDSAFALAPNQDGGFDVRAKKDSGAGLVTLKVGGLSTAIAVGIGVERHVVSGFDDAEQWAVGGARSTQTREKVADGGHDGAALRLAYDFTTSTATRTAYVTAPEWLGKPGKTRSVGLMVRGHGRGEWTAFRVRDGEGNTTNLYGPYITWNGWQEVEVEIPDGMPQPVEVDRFTAIEIDAGKQYEGELLIDDLFVRVAPAIEEPPAEQVRDRLVDSTGRVADSAWRFAVMSDAQFVAREPDSPLVEAARRTLREIRATDAEFVVIAGDLVDEGSVADFALAERVLDEELGDELPYYYVPGNHEIMGGPIDNFRAAFGATYRTFDHRGTRFVTLDTSPGSLQGGGFDQIAMLRSALDDAARDRRIHAVVVVQHHPPRDPSVNAVSQLPHRHDAHLIEAWLSEFQHSTGKGAAFVGAHVGRFHASRVDGVPYLVNGNAGKTPSSAPGEGGFSGWSLVGVEPIGRGEQEEARRFPFRGGPTWIAAELRPHVDELTIAAPDEVVVGSAVAVSAEVVQGDRRVPVGYPMSAHWRGGPRVHVGPVDEAGRADIAAFDPATGRLTGLRPGTATLSLTVNATTDTVTLRIVPAGT